MKEYFDKERVGYFDIITILIFLNSVVLISTWDKYISTEDAILFSSTFSALYPLFFMLFLYKPLRNIYVFFTWLIVCSISSYVLFIYMERNESILSSLLNYSLRDINMKDYSMLKYTWLYILSIFLLRVFSFLLQNKELVVPSGFGMEVDAFDGRKVSKIDYILFSVYYLVWLGLITYYVIW